jgi:hypothetical protein
MMRTQLNDEERSMLIRFIWGRARLPLPSQTWEQKFKIDLHTPRGEVDRCLPVAHTCFFTLDLPKYSTLEIMTERLRFSFVHCQSVDGDSSLNTGGGDINAADTSDDE